MHKVRQRVESFLRNYGMDYASVDMEDNCRRFMDEMQKGLDSTGSSLMMIPTYISMDSEIPVNEPVIVIDAGGTNFRVAVVYFDNDKKPVVDYFKLYPMPGTKGEVSKEEFFGTMAGYLEPVLDRSGKISFCFSYPVEIFPSKDGRLTRFSKEIKAKSVEGQVIGESLLEAVRNLGYTGRKSVILLNDTVATLLAGKASFPNRVFDSYIGFILGTGTNTCYMEKNCNIGKLPGYKNSEGSMIINIESGNYNKAPRGKIDLEFDSGTQNPGDYAFEKAISGAYQGGLILAVIKKAVGDGLFSDEFREKLLGVGELSSKQIDDYLYYPYGDNILARCCSSKTGEDRVLLYYLIDAIFERAARFVTFNLTAVMLRTGKGTNPCAPVCITADGSSFYKSRLFRGKLDYYIKTYTNDIKGVYCEFVKVENAPLIGTAIAGLLN
jgi:hexokinase